MTLQVLCEPLFQYICRINRAVRKGASPDRDHVRLELKSLFEKMSTQASEDVSLFKQYEQVELALIFFVDFMIKESPLSWASSWEELAYERNHMTGDEQFFEMLEETLADHSPEATERLIIYYQCIGLGFTGARTGQYEMLRSSMLECSSRIEAMIKQQDDELICNAAYEGVDKRDLVEHPGRKLGALSIALAVLIITLFGVNIILYRTYSAELRTDLRSIAAHAPWIKSSHHDKE